MEQQADLRGAALAAELGATAVYLHYNSGRYITAPWDAAGAFALLDSPRVYAQLRDCLV